MLKKYNLELPINDIQVFEEFQKRLREEDFLRADVMEMLRSHVQELYIAKTISTILKSFVTKSLARKFTAARKSRTQEDTKKFKDTQLWLLMKIVFMKFGFRKRK